MKSIKAFIFDMGGVITPVEPWDGWEPTKEQRALVNEAILDLVSKKDTLTIEEFKREFKIKTRILPDQFSNQIISSITSANQELLQLITKLKKTYSIYGLANAPYGWTELRMSLLKLDNYFSGFFASHEIGIRKPDERIYHYLLEKTKLKPEDCLFVDDKTEYVDGAKKVGMLGYIFDSTSNFKIFLDNEGLLLRVE